MAADAVKLRFFASYIEEKSGIVYGQSNHFQLVRRLEEIAVQRGLRGVEELYDQAKRDMDGTLRDMLLDVATNNETSFFRDAGMFKALEEVVFPSVLAKITIPRALRIWSAAASTGQEAYSVAMTLEQMRSKGVAVPEFSILGTDISERVLARGKEGAYSQLEVQRGLPARMLVKHFDKTNEGRWIVKPDLRRRVRFEHLNLLGEWRSLPKFDVIFCRNVLIYQSVANKSKVIRRLYEHLLPGGVLILGATETMLGLPERDLFQDERTPTAFFFRRPA